jgi:hypothetical protein
MDYDEFGLNATRLDGNAAAGTLEEIFHFEMTTAVAACGRCGAERPLGAALLHTHGMGMILRCSTCDQVLMRITQIRGTYRLDLSGMSSLIVGTGAYRTHLA